MNFGALERITWVGSITMEALVGYIHAHCMLTVVLFLIITSESG
jgi:hypothetical protein